MLFLLLAIQPTARVPDTQCPDPAWLENMTNCSISNPMVFVIGGNKGYDCIGWARFFSNGLAAPTSKEWSERLPNTDRGVCGQGDYNYPLGAQQNPTVVCVEPMPENYHALKAASRGLKQFYVRQAAVTLTNQEHVYFPNDGFGREDLQILDKQEPETVLVQAITVDKLASHYTTPNILSIDTEGHDALVLLGAAGSLASGKIKYIEFEYHSNEPWLSYKLKWVIDYLDNLHYDCFWAGNDGTTTKITGKWRDEFEFHAWSNVVCAHRKHPCWLDALIDSEIRRET